MNPAEEIKTLLRENGQLAPDPTRLTPLGGGVLCEIFKVEQGAKIFVVKRALAKLRVAADWRADVGRNAVEHAFYETMAGPLASSVPRVFFYNPARGYFALMSTRLTSLLSSYLSEADQGVFYKIFRFVWLWFIPPSASTQTSR